MAVITLTTDFGHEDPYVGLVKGAILSVNPQAAIVDLTHYIPPFDCPKAARAIAWAYPYFPLNTVHTVVVDPGVGGRRRILAFRHADQFFLGPDNGVFSVVLRSNRPPAIFSVENSAYFRPRVSHTFHGRDIFAPVAAHLSKGVPLAELGPALDPGEVVVLGLDVAGVVSSGHIRGFVVDVDRFGNLITDIQYDLLARSGAWEGKEELEIRFGQTHILGIVDHYAAGSPGDTMALIGSRETVEISVNQGNAARKWGAVPGQAVDIVWPFAPAVE
jgi:S-adenosylmethionine hydrolase